MDCLFDSNGEAKTVENADRASTNEERYPIITNGALGLQVQELKQEQETEQEQERTRSIPLK